MAKLNRESRLRERRAEKQAKKAARKLTAAEDREAGDALVAGEEDQPATDDD